MKMRVQASAPLVKLCTGDRSGSLRRMRGPSRQLAVSAVRTILLTLLALGMVLQPVLAAVGEYHDIEHSPAGTHAHALHASELPDEFDPERGTARDVPPADDAPTLHVLLHFAHCCGATAAVLTGGQVLDTVPGSETVAVIEPQAPRRVSLPAPFKPPISA